jgi:hypothetical protein
MGSRFWQAIVCLLFVGLSILVWWFVPTSFWQYILLLRVPIVLGLLLFLFPFAATISLSPLSPLFKNLFVMGRSRQLAMVMMSSTMAGVMISFVLSLILDNAPARFDLPIPITVSLPTFSKYIFAGILILPTWWKTIEFSLKDKELKLSSVRRGAIVGSIGSILLVVIVGKVESFLNSWHGFKQFIARWILLFAKGHPEGYLNSQNELTNGHLAGLALFFVGLFLYIIVILVNYPKESVVKVSENKSIAAKYFGDAPALLYILLLVWIVALFFSGATLYSDYFRVPALIFFIVFAAATYVIFGIEHFFKLKDIAPEYQNCSKPENLNDFKTAIDERLKHQTGKRTLVAICASGGGIQAAGWTVQVLKGLQEELTASFTQAIGLISSVSGGSVGAMYFLDRCDRTLRYPASNEAFDGIFDGATGNSLDAVGWGLAYPDLLRGTSLLFLVDKYMDRAEAMELNWQKSMLNPNATIANRREQILKGEIPIHVSNATLVEDGRRFLISPMTFIEANNDRNLQAIDFNNLYPNSDLNVTTAARLSATFPYVSPLARDDRNLANYHIADGGYFDNSGLFTTIEWLDKWLEPDKNLDIDRVLIVQIEAFANPLGNTANNKDKKFNGGWWMEWLGPLLALSNVRDATQSARNTREIKLLTQDAKVLKQELEQKVNDKCQTQNIEIQEFTIAFPERSRNGEKFEQPLSWKLTKKQKENLKEGWQVLLNEKNSSVDRIKKVWQNWGMM